MNIPFRREGANHRGIRLENPTGGEVDLRPLDGVSHLVLRADEDLVTVNGSDEVIAYDNPGVGGAAWDFGDSGAGRRHVRVAESANGNGAPSFLSAGGLDVFRGAVGSYHDLADGDDLSVAALVYGDNVGGGKTLISTDPYTTGGFRISGSSTGVTTSYAYDSSSSLSDDGATWGHSKLTAVAMVFTGATSGTPDKIETFIDGVSDGSATADIGAPTQSGAGKLIVGAINNFGTGSFLGEIFELHVYKGIYTASQDAALAAAWRARYGYVGLSVAL